jgi:hypothetical protein
MVTIARHTQISSGAHLVAMELAGHGRQDFLKAQEVLTLLLRAASVEVEQL